MATIKKFPNGRIVIKSRRVSCSCCEEGPTPVPVIFALETSGENISDCILNDCGFTAPNGPTCDKTRYSTQTLISRFLNGSVATTIWKRIRINGICTTFVESRDCVEAQSPFGPLPCRGLSEPEYIYTGAVENPICANFSGGYAPYRYQGPPDSNGNATFWLDPCLTQPYPPAAEWPSSWSFADKASNYDYSPLGSYGIISKQINVRYRIRHSIPSSCYFKAWLETRINKYKTVQNNCSYSLVNDGISSAYSTYVWDGGEECNPSTACEDFIYSPNYDLIAGTNETRSVSIYKYSTIRGYEPPDPS